MAIVYNTTTSAAFGGQSATPSVAHTAAAGNPFSLVRLYTDQNADPTGATYGGVAMTLKRKFILGTSSNTTLWIYYFVNPPASSQTVQVTFSAAALCAIAVSSYTGVDQSTPLGTEAVVETNGAGSISTSVSSAVGELVADFFLGGCSSAASGAGQTDRINTNFGGDIGFRNFGGSEKDGAASVTMDRTITGASGRAGLILVPIKPAAASSGVARTQDGIGTGGMQTMSGGMQGRSRIVVPSNFHAFRGRGTSPTLRV